MLVKIIKEAFVGSSARQHRPVGNLERDLLAAQEALAQGETIQAEAAYASILSIWPEQVEACHQLGRIKGMRGEYQEALDLLETAVQQMPQLAGAWSDLGTVYLLMERYPQAAICLDQSITLGNADLAVWYNLALTHEKQGEIVKAVECYRRVLDVDPRYTQTLRSWFMLQQRLGQHAETSEVLQTILLETPDHAEAHAALGFLLLKQDFQPDQALQEFDAALASGMATAELFGNRGIALQDLGRIDKALESFERALELEPDNPSFRFHRGLAHLITHNFEQGWPDYEMRLLSQDRPQRAFPWPRWDGASLSGKTILIHAEQGMGDELMFASCLPDVIAKSRHCVIECHERLAPLFLRSFPTSMVVGTNQNGSMDWLHELPIIDVCLPIGSLPLHFRRRLQDFPTHQGYLRADPDRAEYWRSRLKSLGAGLKVGLSWRGGTPQSRQRYRSMPLTELSPLFNLPGINFVNLQYGDCQTEISAFHEQKLGRLHHFSEAIADYDETAALVSVLDLVISVCTSVIHLGGALGKPVWVMAPAGPEWRYGYSEKTMPWYPGHRLYRQPELFAWDSVIIAIEKSLKDMIHKPLSLIEQA